MQPTTRLIISLNGDKSFYLWNGTETYYTKLRAAYSDILNDFASDYLYFGFFTLCASTLEYSLNYLIVNHSIEKYGTTHYKKNCNVIFKQSFKDKLLNITSIYTEGRYVSNREHPSFKILEDLIILRNKILHNKEFLNELNIPPIHGEIQGENILIPLKESNVEFELEIEPNYIDTLTKEKCISFGNALGDFKKHIMSPLLNNVLGENPMILINL